MNDTFSKLVQAFISPGGDTDKDGDESGGSQTEVVVTTGGTADELNNLCVFVLAFNLVTTVALLCDPFQRALKRPRVAFALLCVLGLTQLYNTCLMHGLVTPPIKLEAHFASIVAKWSRRTLYTAIFAVAFARPFKPALLVYGLFSLLVDGILLAYAHGKLDANQLFCLNLFFLQNVWSSIVGAVCLIGLFSSETSELERQMIKSSLRLARKVARLVVGALLKAGLVKKKAKAVPFRHLCRADGSNCNAPLASTVHQSERQSGKRSARVVRISGLKERISRRCVQITTLFFEWTIHNFYEALDMDLLLTSSPPNIKYIDSSTFSPTGEPELLFFLRLHLPVAAVAVAAATDAAGDSAGTSDGTSVSSDQTLPKMTAPSPARLQLHLDAVGTDSRVVVSFSTTVVSKIKPRFVRQFVLCSGGFTNLATLNPAHFKATDAYLDESGDLRLQCKLHILCNISPFV